MQRRIGDHRFDCCHQTFLGKFLAFDTKNKSLILTNKKQMKRVQVNEYVGWRNKIIGRTNQIDLDESVNFHNIRLRVLNWNSSHFFFWGRSNYVDVGPLNLFDGTATLIWRPIAFDGQSIIFVVGRNLNFFSQTLKISETFYLFQNQRHFIWMVRQTKNLPVVINSCF